MVTAARVALAFAALALGATVLQSDCIRAYIQADMDSPDGVTTYVEFPKAWWRASWQGMKRPVCKLLQALYGHPRAKDLLHANLDPILSNLGSEKLTPAA